MLILIFFFFGNVDLQDHFVQRIRLQVSPLPNANSFRPILSFTFSTSSLTSSLSSHLLVSTFQLDAWYIILCHSYRRSFFTLYFYVFSIVLTRRFIIASIDFLSNTTDKKHFRPFSFEVLKFPIRFRLDHTVVGT